MKRTRFDSIVKTRRTSIFELFGEEDLRPGREVKYREGITGHGSWVEEEDQDRMPSVIIFLWLAFL